MILLPHLLRSPSLTGAVVPSSPYLARAMSDAARGAGRIIELGAGSGPVTRALSRQFPHTPLTVVELQPSMARRLEQAFPSAEVLALPAATVLDRIVPDEPPGAPRHGRVNGADCADGAKPAPTASVPAARPLVLVSSLPFRSLPPRVHAQTRDAILACLARHPGSWLVQFTYQPRAPFDEGVGWHWRRGRTVVANIPPATVWTLRATP
jgi:phospholipid N-methyltransferase